MNVTEDKRVAFFNILVHPTLTEDEIRKTCDAIISVMELAVK